MVGSTPHRAGICIMCQIGTSNHFMMKIWERYNEDPVFRAVVDQLVAGIEHGMFTPTEAREAAMLAQLLYEDRHPRPITFTRDQIMKGLI